MGNSSSDVRYTFGGRNLDTSALFESASVKDGAIIHELGRLRGGNPTDQDSDSDEEIDEERDTEEERNNDDDEEDGEAEEELRGGIPLIAV